MPHDKLKPNAATQPTEDADDFDGYGSPAYLKWIEYARHWNFLCAISTCNVTGCFLRVA